MSDVKTMRDIELEAMREALKKCAGNKTHAAKLLGISIRKLRAVVNGKNKRFSDKKFRRKKK